VTRIVASVVLALAAAGSAAAADWRPLFNGKDLAGFETYLGKQPGSDAEPLGPGRDPDGNFGVQDGAIHIVGRRVGALTTTESFGNYRLRLEFKWGEKRWPPRENAKRNSGVIYHAVGPHGAHSGNWMRGFQSQVQEGDCGDFHSLDGATIDVEAATLELDGASLLRYTPGAAVQAGVHQRVLHAQDAEKPGWNVMEIVARGATVEHVVNGTTVFRATNLRQPDGTPLTKGRIQLQSEGAEVFYRNIEVQPLE
jgi:Domain of Unknown Function (DUF1080)